VSEATKDQIKGAFAPSKSTNRESAAVPVHASSRSWRSLDQDSSSWWATTTPAASRRTPRPVRTSATRCSGRCPVDTGPDREPRDGGTSRCRDRHRSRPTHPRARWSSLGQCLDRLDPPAQFLDHHHRVHRHLVVDGVLRRVGLRVRADRRGGPLRRHRDGFVPAMERFMMLFVAVNVVMIPLVLHAHVATHSLFRDLAVPGIRAARPRRACCSSSRSSARPSRRGSCTSSRATSSTRRFRHVG